MTTFTAGPGVTTLPIWIYQNLFRPNQAPIVNVVAAALVLVSILPIYIAQRFSNADERGGGLIYRQSGWASSPASGRILGQFCRVDPASGPTLQN